MTDEETVFINLIAGITSDGAAWVPLIEKAWAKLNGNYNNILSGTFSEAMKTLTGVPT
jgi:hypothetical protein